MVLDKRKCMLCNLKKDHLYRFPKEKERFLTWVKILKCENLLQEHNEDYIKNNGRLCSDHFEEKMFSSNLKIHLAKSAIPKVKEEVSVSNTVTDCNSPNVISEIEYQSTYDIATTSKELTPKTKKINKLRVDISKYKRKLFNCEKKKNGLLQNLKSSLTAVQFDFVMSQVKFSNKDPRGRRWTPEQKTMAMNIYYHSPSAYAVLRRYFAFPCKTTLKKSTKHIAKDEGICPIVLNNLKERVKKMKDEELWCTLILDEMAIKSSLNYNSELDRVDGFESIPRNGPPQLATQALVFMIRGVFVNFKQVIAYYFRGHTSDNIWMKEKFLEIVDALLGLGLKLIATVCDQGPINQGLYRDLSATADTPYFVRNGHKIYTLWDVPHLLKSVRNNLLKHDIFFEEIKECNDKKMSLEASWKHIQAFYESDSKKTYRLSPKITAKHIYAEGLNSMKVKYAAQVFSNTVAAGISNYAENGQLEMKALGTAEFVANMNNLFDTLNSKQLFGKTPYSCALSNESVHVDYWKKCIDWIKSWRITNASGKRLKPACQKGFVMTLNAVLCMWEVLGKQKQFLLTNRLNQDCIENAFSSIRRHGGNRDNPDASQFRSAIRYVIVHNFLKKSRNANCEDDSDFNLLQVSTLSVSAITLVSEDFEDEDNMCYDSIRNNEIPTVDIIEENALAYISGFISKSYIKKFSCELCETILIGDKFLEPHTLFLYFKDYHPDSKYGLKWPTENFYEYIKELGSIFCKCIDINFNKSGIKKKIFATLCEVNFDFFTCLNHFDTAKRHIINSFVTMMIKHKIKTLNSASFETNTRKKIMHFKNL